MIGRRWLLPCRPIGRRQVRSWPGSGGSPGAEFLGVADGPDAPDAVACDVEGEHGHDDVLPLESARVQVVYGGPSAVNRVLILNAEPHPGRGTVLLLREAIGY